MNQNLTEIIIVLDSSGSMESVKPDTIGGYNAFLKAQAEAPGECAITLWTFSDESKCTFLRVPSSHLNELSNETYKCSGNTALHDAIGKAIDATGQRLLGMPEEQRPAKVMLIIITDGMENASKWYLKDRIAALIKHQRETYNWQFVYIGANQDAILGASALNISPSNALNYTANAVGTSKLYRSMATNSVSFRTGAADSMAFNEEDRVAQEEAK